MIFFNWKKRGQLVPNRQIIWTGGGTSALPPTPTNLTASGNRNSIGLSWNQVSVADYYNIYRSTDTGTEVLYDTSNTNTYTDTNVNFGVVYYYKVQAVNNPGSSGLSNETNAEILRIVQISTAAMMMQQQMLPATPRQNRRSLDDDDALAILLLLE